MYIYSSRLQETSRWLDDEWQAWKKEKAFQGIGESQLMEMFLNVVEAVGSSIDRAYIDAWYEQRGGIDNEE